MNDLSISEPQRRFGMREQMVGKSKDGIYHRSRPVKSTLRFYIVTVDRKFAMGRRSFFTKCKFMPPMVYGVRDFAMNPRGGQGYGQEFVSLDPRRLWQ